MKVRAELHCFHCGYSAARIEGIIDVSGGPVKNGRLLAPPSGPGFKKRPGSAPLCGRCGGPLFLDDVEVIRYAPTVIVPLPPGRRRGRPPKALVS